MTPCPRFVLLFFVALLTSGAADACQSCLLDLTRGGFLGSTEKKGSSTFHASSVPIGIASGNVFKRTVPSLRSVGLDHALGFLLVRKLITSLNTKEINDSTIPKVQEMTTKFRHQLRSKSESDTVENDAGSEKQTKSEEGEAEIMSQSMIMAIGFYKQFISPLLPPACRFLPTCSQYGVQAIKEFGPSKGVILTAWRLARCSPFGGRGE